MAYKDKEKQLKSRRDWYQRNKETERKAIKERRKKLSEWLKDYKVTRGCGRCSENHPACLDFHHEGGKEVNISKAIRVHGWGKEKILKEIGKCIILCSNCHRKEHYE